MSVEYHKSNLTETGEMMISHSHLCKLDPILGGHPKMFYKSVMAPEVVEKPSFETGNLMHLWMQKRDQFIIEDLSKPTEQPAKLAESFNDLYLKEGWKSDSTFLELVKHDTTIGVLENDKYRDLFEEINKRDAGNKEEFAVFVACVRFARLRTEYNKNLKEGTFLEKFGETVPYINFLNQANGKVILTQAMRDILFNCADSINRHPFAARLLELDGLHEAELFWNAQFDGGEVINRKAKLDLHAYDEDKKILFIVDLKTTSFPVSLYTDVNGGYHRYRAGRQLVNYEEGFFKVHKEFYSPTWKIGLFNIVVQITDEYPTMVYQTNGKSRYTYTQELRQLERRALYHIHNNMWDITMEEHSIKDGEFIMV